MMDVSVPAVDGAYAYHVYVSNVTEVPGPHVVTIEPVGEATTISVYADGTWIVNGEEWT